MIVFELIIRASEMLGMSDKQLQELTNMRVKSMGEAKALLKDWPLTVEYLMARLVLIAGSDSSQAVRAIDLLLGLPGSEADDVEDLDDIAERYAVEWLTEKGYGITAPDGGGSQES